LLAQVGLADRRDAYPDRLSGGEQQRIAVARALVHDPLLVLADEPTGNLDEETGQQVLDLLDRLTRRAGKNLLMVTHSPDVVGLADRAFRMTEGHLVEEARIREPEYNSQHVGASLLSGKAEHSDDILWKLLNTDT
ncbi:MAG: ATP-binding cassette domain-containing protein, partial [Roseiflexaceae bacterium]